MRRSSLMGGLFLICSTLAASQSQEEVSLEKAVRIALECNPEILNAHQAIDVARGRFWRGISPPPASVSWTYDYIPASTGFSGFGERRIELSQSIEFPTTIVLRGSSLSSETDAAEADYRHASLVVAFQVKEAYYGVLAGQQKLVLAEENYAIARDFALKAEIRYNVGEATPLELLTARVQRTQAQNNVETERTNLRIALGALNLAMGRGKEGTSPGLLLTDSLVYRPCSLDLASLVEDVGESNPLVQSAIFRAEAASDNRAIAWSSILPTFSLSYSRQMQGGNPNLYGVALGISLPIWFLFDQRGQIQEASATLARMESDLVARRNAVVLEARNAWLEFTNDERQVLLFRDELLPQAGEVYRAAAESYDAGEITYLEYLQARQTLITVHTSSIDALFHYNAALARLEKAVGRTLGE